MYEKEGLLTAIDFTKFLMTLAGGAIVFIIQPDFVKDYKFMSFFAIILFFVCVTSGLFVFAGGCTMLANKDYDLNRRWVRIPGIVNVISFAMGFFIIILTEISKLYRL